MRPFIITIAVDEFTRIVFFFLDVGRFESWQLPQCKAMHCGGDAEGGGWGVELAPTLIFMVFALFLSHYLNSRDEKRENIKTM